MPAGPVDATEPVGIVLAGVVALAACFLAWKHWRDLKARPAEVSPVDERHYFRQDLRRVLGTIVLLVLAVGLVLGSRMPPRVGGRANLAFFEVWVGVAFLLVVLLILALLDWFATRTYERRHRGRLTREGLAIVEAELRIRRAIRLSQNRNGHADEVEDEDQPAS